MKRFIKAFLLLAALAGIPTGCMDNMIEVENITQTELIGFTTTTTRASSVDLTAMKDDPTGFRVFATGGNAPDRWYKDDEGTPIDGSNHHRWNNGKWGFNMPVKWSKSGDDYPMKFYAYFPASSVGFEQFTEIISPNTSLTAFYTVQAVNKQEDLMAARITTSVRPASGTVGLVFHHILSKINFGIIAGTGSLPMIQSLEVVNAKDKRGFSFVEGSWFTQPVGLASYRYYPKAPSGGGAIPVFIPDDCDGSAANPFYKGAHGNHLMLMPQVEKSWKPTSSVQPLDLSGGYVCLIYRMNLNDVETPCLVGMDDATKHPDHATKGAGYTGPLFVKAGFPLPADGSGNFTWEKGYSYLYNIVLGTYDSSNGYIIDENYYDENGNRTNLPLLEIRDEIKLPGDKLNDGNIHFILNVNEWDKDDESEVGKIPKLNVTPSVLSFENDDASGKAVYVSTNQPGWAATCDKPWVTINPATGINGQTFTVTVANNSGATRTATITVTAGGVTKTVSLIQELAFSGWSDRITVTGTGDNAKLVLTSIPTDPGVFFKFGSVVSIAPTSAIDHTSFVFNPLSNPAAITGYGSNSGVLPAVPAFTDVHHSSLIRNVSLNNYHYLANVKAGRGDPCRLIGMTAGEIRGFQSDTELYAREEALKIQGIGGWVLPTEAMNVSFSEAAGLTYAYGVNAYSGVNGVFFRYGKTDNHFLPAVGDRDRTGELMSQGTHGSYWSNEPLTDSDKRASHLIFNNDIVTPDQFDYYNSSRSVRCVRIDQHITPLSVKSIAVTVQPAKKEYFTNESFDETGMVVVATFSDNSTAPVDNSLLNFTYDFSTVGNKTVTIGYQGKTTTVTGIVVRELYSGDLLYFDGNTLKLGNWGSEVNASNIAYFKFGGVVGFDGVGAFNAATSVRFKPVNAAVTAYGNGNTDADNTLPNVPAFWSTDWKGSIGATPSVTDPSYHNRDNVVLRGKGDPCMLVGYTGAQIAAMDEQAFNTMTSQSAWRLPTYKENMDFAGGNHNNKPTWQLGDPALLYHQNTGFNHDHANYYVSGAASPANPLAGGWFPMVQGAMPNTAGTFLPATGNRDTDGEIVAQGVIGSYWSNTVRSDNWGTQLYFGNSFMNPVNNMSYATGSTVRCVANITLSVNPTTQWFNHFEVGVGNSKTVAVVSNQTWSITGNTGSSWLNVSGSGTGNGTITMYPNTSNSLSIDVPRTATITVSGGGLTETITVVQYPTGGGADILYLDGDALQIGRWGNTHTGTFKGEVTSNNIVHFKYGSVVGFKGKGSWNATTSLLFNPTATASYSYANVPQYTGTDFTAGSTNVSESSGGNAYHTGANVKAGKGDPCRLVGLSAAQIKGMSDNDITNYNSGWRMPTVKENTWFVGGPDAAEWAVGGPVYPYFHNASGLDNYNFLITSGASNYPTVSGGDRWKGGWFPVPYSGNNPPYTASNNYLPIGGTRSSTNGGAANAPDANMDGGASFYWSSTAQSNTDAYVIIISGSNFGSVSPTQTSGYATGVTIRCVSTGTAALTVTPGTLAFADNVSGSGNSQKVTVNTNQSSWSYSVSGDVSAFTVSQSANMLTVYPNSANTTTTPRTATITVNAGAAAPVTVTVTQEEYIAIGGADIIYFDGDVLRVGKWGAGNPVNSTNIAYFQFGSVVGFNATGGWNATTSLKFNPTGAASYNYTSIPNYGTSPANTAWMGNVNNSYAVSSATYHTGARVKQGWGDPCKLVGLSATDIRGATGAAIVDSHNSGWRLPTAKENTRFVGGKHNDYPAWQPGGSIYEYTPSTGTLHNHANYWVASGPAVSTGTQWAGAWFPFIQGASPNSSAGQFLPAAGNRTSAGTVSLQGNTGSYWSSTAQSGTNGHILHFNATAASPVNHNAFTSGYTIRCVSVIPSAPGPN